MLKRYGRRCAWPAHSADLAAIKSQAAAIQQHLEEIERLIRNLERRDGRD